MSDELTPKERKALDGLPRERLPAGLEERVVGAMREHGFLETRRRTYTLTNTRVAGLLAACVALVIGAYSIGLHRGGGEEMVPAVGLVKQDDSGRADRPAAAAPEKSDEPAPAGKMHDAGEPAREEELRTAESPKDAPPAVQTPKVEQAPAEATLEFKRQSVADSPVPEVPAASEEDRVAQNAPPEKEVVSRESDAVESATAETPAPATVMNESQQLTPATRDAAGRRKSAPSVTYMLDGRPVVVEAPDSVRVVRDARGRMLIIYTSDGIIRVRLGSDD